MPNGSPPESFNGLKIIEPEAEVVDSESIRSDNVLVQSTHPGLQPCLERISTLATCSVFTKAEIDKGSSGQAVNPADSTLMFILQSELKKQFGVGSMPKYILYISRYHKFMMLCQTAGFHMWGSMPNVFH